MLRLLDLPACDTASEGVEVIKKYMKDHEKPESYFEEVKEKAFKEVFGSGSDLNDRQGLEVPANGILKMAP